MLKKKDCIGTFWDAADKETSDEGRQVQAILRYIAKQLSQKVQLASADQKMVEDAAEATVHGCFPAKCSRLKTDFNVWRAGQATGAAGGLQNYELVLRARVAEFKDAIVKEISRKAPESVHLVNYIEQRWASLFGFTPEPDHAAWQGPGSLKSLGLTEEGAAQKFLDAYCRVDPQSPYPNKTVVFGILYKEMEDMAIWNMVNFFEKLMALGLSVDNLPWLYKFDADDVPTGLQPEGAELLLMDMGLLPGKVQEKVAEIKGKAASSAAH